MTPGELSNRDQMDREILAYVRGMQDEAPITTEAVSEYLKHACRRRVSEHEVRGRLRYLTGSGYLRRSDEWDATAGEVVHWTITADGEDLLDGRIPPRNWKPREE